MEARPHQFAFMRDKAREHGMYRAMKKPPRVGDVRMREGAYHIPPTGQTDPAWAARCKEYWELQAAVYGLVLTDFSMVVDYEKGTVRTYSAVQEILPGRRVPEDVHKAWFADMVDTHREALKA